MNSLLVEIYKNPSLLADFDHEQWESLLSEAHCHIMFGRVCYFLKRDGLFDLIPEKIQWHFSSAEKLCIAHAKDIEIETEHIINALKFNGVSPIFLKGASYLLAGDEASKGRLFSDVDIYIDKDKLPGVETVLGWNGWVSEKLSAHDEHYYRNWMHEIPPKVHKSRGITLDVHYSLTPLTSRISFNNAKFRERIADDSYILNPEDRLLHCIVHLFMETEFDKGIRDLTDIDLLIKQFSKDDDSFWEKAHDRAAILGVGRLYFYGLRYTNLILDTSICGKAMVNAKKQWGPNAVTLKLTDWIFQKVLVFPLSRARSWNIRMAHTMAFLRGHWLKMPLHLLIYHFSIKGWLSIRGKFTDDNSV